MPRTPVILAAIALGLLLACAAERPTCYAGDELGCTCAGDQHGYQTCNAAGDGYGACVCDGSTPGLDAGPAMDASLRPEGGMHARDASSEAAITDAGAE